MKFLALQTDIEKIKNNFLCEGECEILTTRYHALSFFFASLREMFATVVLFGFGVGAWYMNAPMALTIGLLSIVWVVFVLFSFLKAYIDWRFDFIFVTTDKIVLVDQTSIIRQKVQPIHIENVGSVTSETQFWGIFPFGKIQINLKEGEGGHRVVLLYVPNANIVASQISEVVTKFQRGGNEKNKRSHPAVGDVQRESAESAAEEQ